MTIAANQYPTKRQLATTADNEITTALFGRAQSRLGAAIKLIPSFVFAVLGCKPSPTPVLLHRGTNRSLL
jgi:hypothetical protein